MLNIEKKLSRAAQLVGLFGLAVFCGFLGVVNTFGQTRSKMVEGQDYIILKRVRILDETAFDRPVEAMSILVPSGWRAEGSIRWKGVGECRAEIVTTPISVSSPDGSIQYVQLPLRSFIYSQNSMTQQALITASRQGGCQVSGPFTASQYLQNLAKSLGASAGNIRKDPSLQYLIDKFNQQSSEMSQQYGTGMTYSGSFVYATLTWPDGTKGLAQIGVMGSVMNGQDMYGSPNGFASTTVVHQRVIKYPAAREAEALKIFATINASERVNPIWQKAINNFLTRLGNAEHGDRMEQLRLQGEQMKAYAKQQSAANARMRDWEQSSSSSSSDDSSHNRFIQTIREVETWKDGEGRPVELGSGYSHGWSKPDGSYILTNNSLFNPAVEFQQNWTRMQKPD